MSDVPLFEFMVELLELRLELRMRRRSIVRHGVTTGAEKVCMRDEGGVQWVRSYTLAPTDREPGCSAEG